MQKAIEIARADPPLLTEGDFVEVLPALPEQRDRDPLTIVYASVSTIYLRDDETARLGEIIEAEGRRGSLAWVSYEIGDNAEIGYLGFALDVQRRPGGGRKRLAHLDGYANRLEWLGAS